MKTDFKLSIDSDLKQIIQKHCKCHNKSASKYFAELVAQDLNIPLNHNGSVDKDALKECKIRKLIVASAD